MFNKKSNSRIFSFLLALALIFIVMGVKPALAVKPAKDLLSVEQFLNPDVMLNAGAGYSGSLDIGSYNVMLEPMRSPVFSPPAPTLNAWNSLGADLYVSVNAVAISGTDVYAGGVFTDSNGNPNADYIAKLDTLTGTWSALGTTPLNGPVSAIAVSGTDVYIAGGGNHIGGIPTANGIAKYDTLTDTWSALGGGLNAMGNSGVSAIAISGTDIYVGGRFTQAGDDNTADHIAKFNTLTGTWSALGSTQLNDRVTSIAVSGTDVYAGGYFTDAGGHSNADYIAKFSGGAWSALSSTPLNNNVNTIAINGVGDVYAGGMFVDADGNANADYIAKFSGGAWSALGTTPLNGQVSAIAINGTDVYASGWFGSAGGVNGADYISKFSGGVWSALGTTPLNSFVAAIAISGTGDVYAGGEFTQVGDDPTGTYIARFSGGVWSPLGSDLQGYAAAIAISGTDVYVGGQFTCGGVYDADYIAKYDALTGEWSQIGTTILNGPVRGIAISGTDVYAVGGFMNAGGNDAADYVAKLDTLTGIWSALGGGLNVNGNGGAEAIAISGTDVYVGGRFTQAGDDNTADHIAKFNTLTGTWSALGMTPLNNRVTTIAINGAGDVYAGGLFTDAGGDANADYIAKFSSSAWSALGATPLNNSVNTIAINGVGDVYAGGPFQDAGGDVNADHIAKFSGGAWSALGSGLTAGVNTIAISGTDVYVGGYFGGAGGVDGADFIAKFSGGAWSALGATPLNSEVGAIAISGTGDVYAGGEFTAAGDDPSANYIARFVSAPEMDVKGNGVSIADDDITPSVADDTDFGSADITSATVDHVFTIENTGYADLNLTGAPKVSISGSTDFSVIANPASPVIPSGSTTFTVRFDPSELGTRTATISIANNDSGKNPYNFDIQGAGTATETVSDGETQTFGSTITITDAVGGNNPGVVTVTLTNTAPAGVTPVPGQLSFWIDIDAAVNTGLNVSLTLCYSLADIPAGVSESSLELYTFSGGVWTDLGFDSHDLVNHCVTKNNITHFSVWTLVPDTVYYLFLPLISR